MVFYKFKLKEQDKGYFESYICQLKKKKKDTYNNVIMYNKCVLVTYGPYWDHVSGYWNLKDNSNFLIIKYEDMKKVN